MESALNWAVNTLKQGKAVSTDLIPDDVFSKEQLKKIVRKDLSLIFSGPRPKVMESARAILLSKLGTRLAQPEDTRMIVCQTLLSRIYDRVCLYLVRDNLQS